MITQFDLLAALVVFCVVTLFTPGPNNIMLMTTGLNFGFRRALPHLFGVALGFGAMVLADWKLQVESFTPRSFQST